MACVVGDSVEESFVGLVTKAGERISCRYFYCLKDRVLLKYTLTIIH